MTNADLVREWHLKFGVPAPVKPCMGDSNRKELRLNLIEEELQEFREADNIVDVADALADLLYVVYGSAIEFGLPINAIFREVHRSNMSKVWPDGTVHYRDDGKVIKPETYSPPSLEQFL